MTRDLSSGMAAAITVDHVAVILADLEFESGTVRMWSGGGIMTWNGNDYTGGGNLIGISSYEETESLEARGMVLKLSGIPSSLLSIALSENYQYRPCKLYLGVAATKPSLVQEDGSSYILQEDGSKILLENTLIDDPYRFFSGQMDVMEISDDTVTSTISISVENILARLRRKKIRRYTSEDQKSRFSGDTFFDRVAALQDREIVWGTKG